VKGFGVGESGVVSRSAGFATAVQDTLTRGVEAVVDDKALS